MTRSALALMILSAALSGVPGALGAESRASQAAPSRRVNRSPLPSWVEVLSPDLSAKAPDGSHSDGVFFLLADTQVHVEREELYCHYAVKILSDSGVQSSSSVEADWDPSFQRLDFHFIRVHRGGRTQERLDPGAFSVIQREKNLESFMYDGSLSAILFLEDVRRGDVIEYAFTVGGRNPVFGGAFADSRSLSFSVPVARLRHRLVHPRSRPLRTRGSGEGMEPVRLARGEEEELVWDRSGIGAVMAEDGLPGWYEPFAYAEQSEWDSWAEVADWARGLFLPRMEAGAGIKALAADLRKEHPGREEAVLAAIRFAQEEVRYLGIEIGAFSHRPNDPEAVLKRRYGDCKDKALLLCALLRELGEEAHPALVSTDSGPRLEDFLPSPYAFDHAVAVLEYGGRRLWIDPTVSAQRGSLESLSFPDYGFGLVLAPGEAELRDIPEPEPGSISISEDFALSDDPGKRDLLTVKSVFSGPEADDLRFRFANESRESLAKDFLDYYSSAYGELSREGGLEIEDDEEANVFAVTERFRLDLGGKAGERGQADFRAGDIASYLVLPEEGDRRMPFSLGRKVKVSQTMRVAPLDDAGIDEEAYEASCPEFDFRYSSEYADAALALSWNLEVSAESVAPDRIGEYRAKAGEALDYVDYGLSFSAGREPAFDGEFLLVLALAALFAAASGFLFSLRGYSLPAPAFLSPGSRLGSALGAKLGAPAPTAGLVFQAAALVGLVLDALLSRAARPGKLAALLADWPSGPGGAFGAFLLGEGAVQAAIAGLCAIGLVLSYFKRREAPALYGLQAACLLPAALVDLCAASLSGAFDNAAIIRKSIILGLAAAQAAVVAALMLSDGAKEVYRNSGPLFGFETSQVPDRASAPAALSSSERVSTDPESPPPPRG